MPKITTDTEFSLFRFTHDSKLDKSKWGMVVAHSMKDALEWTEDIEAIEYVDVTYISAGIINDLRNEWNKLTY